MPQPFNTAGSSAARAAVTGLKLDNDDEAVGAAIVAKALEEPLKWIAQNAGLEGAVMVQQVERETGATPTNS